MAKKKPVNRKTTKKPPAAKSLTATATMHELGVMVPADVEVYAHLEAAALSLSKAFGIMKTKPTTVRAWWSAT